MKARFGVRRGTALVAALLVAVIALILPGSAVARTDDGRAHSDHWGVIARNTIGSPVAELRNGPFGPFGATGTAARPPYGRGSLGIEVSGAAQAVTPTVVEKVDFGNEVDFFGKQLLGLRRIGFHVFQTGENVGYGGTTPNMPNIRFEIDPNVTGSDDYSTLVWVPASSPVTNGWSPFLDATRTGYWYLTGNETTCTRAAQCTFAQLKASFTNVNAKPTVYTVAVGKGRDFMWTGAVDGLRLNDYVYDFERDGVKVLRAK
ncbi:hypothetical protein [Streptomyces sp. NBC_01334]|uniref:hypothetical protein n=1 Tax=Streptomyces sp. NBC_01334 TaxID=2903827 RepID=UPI002E0DE572|nr:hypothetical protein OG736_23595 [Streptomyces sp. NBC_01334]